MERNQKKDIALLALTNLWQEIANATIMVKLPEVSMNLTEYTRVPSSEKKGYIKTSFVIVHPELLQNSNKGERDMIIKIMAEMKRNNALWHFDYLNSIGRKDRVLNSLRKRGILIKTDNNTIHIVNPWMIRKGDLRTQVATTAMFIEKKKAWTRDMIKDLKAPAGAKVNGYFALLAN